MRAVTGEKHADRRRDGWPGGTEERRRHADALRAARRRHEEGRLEADVVGKGTAWIATNGTTIKGTWRKDSLTEPTRFFDAAGKPVTLTVGQTFVQVMQTGSKVTLTPGAPPPPPDPSSARGPIAR